MVVKKDVSESKTISLKNSVWKKVDKMRGIISRSKFISELLLEDFTKRGLK